jgi:hypothetical protein
MRLTDYDRTKLSSKEYNRARFTKNTNKPCYTLVGKKYVFDEGFLKQLDLMFMDTELCELSRKQNEAWLAYITAVEEGTLTDMVEQLDIALGKINYIEEVVV